ncbi:MAG: membrane protein of unknown function [Promethearchaeota archaeon]|nr:MAG: membrane protein of unknown function [Candidatus Lokiarchaeota archaeon]
MKYSKNYLKNRLKVFFTRFGEIEIKISLLKLISLFFGIITMFLFNMGSMIITGNENGYSFLIIKYFNIFFKKTSEITFSANLERDKFILIDEIINFSNSSLIFIGYLFLIGVVSDIFYLKFKVDKKNLISRFTFPDLFRINAILLCSMGLILYYFGIYVYAFLFQNELSKLNNYTNINIIIEPNFGLVFGIFTVIMVYLEGIVDKDLLLYKKKGFIEKEGLIEVDAKILELS